MGARKRRPNYVLIAGGLFIAILVGLAIFFNVRRAIPLEGEVRFSPQGNAHIEAGGPNTFAYNSMPPTSGPHYGSLAAWGVHSEPVPYESLVHNLEDGGIVIYYQCADGCPEIRDALVAIVKPLADMGRNIVLTPNVPQWTDGSASHQDIGAPIVLTAWNRTLSLESVDEDRIRAFIAKYHGIDRHSGAT